MTKQEPRIGGLEKGNSWLWKFARWLSIRRFGKVITPLKVVYSRKPALIPISGLIDYVREKKLRLDQDLRFLALVRASQVNQCSFCHDLVTAQAIRAKLGTEKFAHLLDWRTSPAFTHREKALLAAVDDLVEHTICPTESFRNCGNSFPMRRWWRSFGCAPAKPIST
ncbi:MAG: carboxymuconolactone decarboxylase family protein [Candidatus Binatia bacterium]|nr:carboxymuconolactone decarboxylase family protein [Candidatus Binatia bacterium]